MTAPVAALATPLGLCWWPRPLGVARDRRGGRLAAPSTRHANVHSAKYTMIAGPPSLLDSAFDYITAMVRKLSKLLQRKSAPKAKARKNRPEDRWNLKEPVFPHLRK